MTRAASASAPSAQQVKVSRGRMDKRQAILDAAMLVFAREGYAKATVDAIALEANVAKLTIYKHLGGKENLFRYVLTETSARATEQVLSVLHAFPAEPKDLRADLEAVARQMAHCNSEPWSRAVRRLIYAEITRFPDLLDSVWAGGPNQINEVLAGRLARLANAGYLEIHDPVRAAAQFVALITEEMPTLTALDTKPADEAELERAVADGVDTFLRAFTPRG